MAVSLEKGEIWTQRHAQRGDGVQRDREKTDAHKPRRGAGNRSILMISAGTNPAGPMGFGLLVSSTVRE